MGPRRFPKIIKATKKSAPVDALEKTKIPTGVLEKPVSAEEAAALEKLSDLSFLESQGIKPGSMAQLQFPETFASTIADADLADWATKLGRKLRLDSLTKQTPELPDQSRRTKILTREEMRKKREEGAAIQQVKERKQKEFEEGKTEGARDIDLSKLRAAGVAGAAIGAGMLANSPSARADEGPTISQSNPEHSSNSTSNTVRKAAAEEQGKSNLLNALETYGTAARSGVSSAFLGATEPVVSRLSAAVGSLISAGFDAEDALDFVKKATSPERFKKEYESDVEYRKRMQKEHPIADISGSLAGAFSPVGPAAKIAGLIGKGTAKAGEALYKAGALKKLSGAVGAPAARAITKTGLAAGEGAAFIPAVSFPEQKIKELAGFSEPSEHSVFDELNEPSTLEEAESGAKIQGGVKSGVELAKLLKRLRR